MMYTEGVPRFAACTRISFCHPLVYIVPYSISVDDTSRTANLGKPGIVKYSFLQMLSAVDSILTVCGFFSTVGTI